MDGGQKQEKLTISCRREDLKKLVDLWKKRSERCEELDYYLRLGGDNWLYNQLLTDPKLGITESSLPQRVQLYGSNLISMIPKPCN